MALERAEYVDSSLSEWARLSDNFQVGDWLVMKMPELLALITRPHKVERIFKECRPPVSMHAREPYGLGLLPQYGFHVFLHEFLAGCILLSVVVST